MAVAIARIADEIDAKVIAEGIETTAERNIVVDAGITFGQGYLLGKPSPITARAAHMAQP
jgi:EAL domain-containing protein (putative c-di-GMP-specific phosphodiesterase class I)